jgi:opacity protein-like surface antigen
MRTLLLVLLCCARAAAQDAPPVPHTLALGVNYLGGQLDYDFGRGHRLELRYLTGKTDSDEGRITSSTLGLRGYQRFKINGPYHPYVGAEVAYVNSKVGGGVYSVHGFAPGVFVGIDRKLWRRISAGLDIGPYLFALNERSTDTRTTSVDIIANVFILVHIF